MYVCVTTNNRYVYMYATNYSAFMNDFGTVFTKMSRTGYSSSQLYDVGDLVSSGYLIYYLARISFMVL